ncbi:MAG: S9 family peptidase, partial [Bacteroidia bacterium]|nr:S9 family peptidase [Bacteroidia bacterium]
VLEWSDYTFTDDEQKVILTCDEERIYRHSTKANHYVFDIKSKKTTAVSADGKQRYATLSPDNKHLAFVRGNNLYIKNFSSGKETAITTDGEHNKIINGATDWVYEEEFAFDRAYQWSADGNKIAFYRFDESKVKDFTMMRFGELYPEEVTFKYPKAGEDNALIDIYIYDIPSSKKVKADVGTETDMYIPRIKWTEEPNQLCIFKMNRHQNNLDLLLCDGNTGSTKLIMNEKSETFIEIDDDLTFLDDGKRFIWTSMRDGYNHIYLFDMQGKLLNQITKGEWDVANYYGYNNKTQTFFYQSAEKSPLERHVYSINLEGKKKNLTKQDGSNSAAFSSTMDYFLHTNTASAVAHTYAMRDGGGKEKYVLEDNEELNEALKEYDVKPVEFVSFKTSDNVELNAWMIKPPNFDANKKYPVLMYVYGGPGSQTVQNSWGGANFMWYNMLAQNGYIVVSVDNRGTGSRGEAFRNCTYKNLGHLETLDQIEAAKFLSKMPYVDADRIGIWGWSYGGYMTALCLSKGDGIFKAGISIAPVTNWRYYDTIYTERYLRTPQENASGYDDNSPINFVKDLQGSLFLVHGTADDNVHYQNSMEYVNELVKHNIDFDMFMYPNKNHSIYGGATRYHLYNKMTNFILEKL